MTDPVTNVEIEDVLSSIRRLVSENTRTENKRSENPAAPPKAAPEAEHDVPIGHEDAAESLDADMLVLTPALMVPLAPTEAKHEVSPELPAEHDLADNGDWDGKTDAFELKDDPDESRETDETGLNAAIQDAVHDAIEAAVADAAADVATEASAEQTTQTEGADDWTEDADAEPSAFPPEGAVEFVHADASDEIAADMADNPEGMASLEDRIAGLEAVVAERDDQWEPDGESEDDYAAAPVDTLSWEDNAEPVHGWEPDPLGEVEDAEVLDNNGGVEATPAESVSADSAADGIAGVAPAEDTEREEPALEQPVPEPAEAPIMPVFVTPRQSPPEAASAPADEAAPALDDALAPQPEMADVGETADPQLAQGLDDDTDLMAAEESVIDEDMLRDLVAEIVRQELQGNLGERITRNVRKLVRREIHRALAARELN